MTAFQDKPSIPEVNRVVEGTPLPDDMPALDIARHLAVPLEQLPELTMRQRARRLGVSYKSMIEDRSRQRAAGTCPPARPPEDDPPEPQPDPETSSGSSPGPGSSPSAKLSPEQILAIVANEPSMSEDEASKLLAYTIRNSTGAIRVQAIGLQEQLRRLKGETAGPPPPVSRHDFVERLSILIECTLGTHGTDAVADAIDLARSRLGPSTTDDDIQSPTEPPAPQPNPHPPSGW